MRMLVVCALAGIGLTAHAQIPAFPGAEGYGAFARGGRGGDVYVVTNLNSSGAGSLSNGITTAPTNSGRTIVFAVSGWINLNGGTLRVVANNITIAGQTAPGDGIGLREGTFRVTGSNLLVQHVRFRNGRSADCVNVDAAAANTIFDHCEMTLSNDENMSSFSDPPDLMTVQWSTNAWGMETHSAGGLWDVQRATAHHMLWAHNHTRNPKARPWGVLDWINNITFDWDIGFIPGDSETPADWKANVIGSYFISTGSKSRAFDSARLDRNGDPNFSVYVENNRFDGNANGVLDGTDTGWGLVGYTVVAQLPTAVPVSAGLPVTVDHPLTAYKKIVSGVGPLRMDGNPSRPLRDEAAAILVSNLVAQRKHRVFAGAVAGTGASNGGYGTLISNTAPADTDNDGIPDYYEKAVGLSHTIATNNGLVPNSGGVITGLTFFPANTSAGYTNLEEYLFFMALPHSAMEQNTVRNLDLRKFTSGFTKNPVFTLSNLSGGNAAQSGPGGALVEFTPNAGFTGRVKFDFTVTDDDGSTWTQTYGILVTPDALPAEPVSIPVLWKGNGTSHNWNTTASNQVWLDGETPVAWSQLNSATFDDSGFNSPNITVASGGIQLSSFTVNSSKNYTFTGSGALGGAIQFSKSGPGTVTFNNTGGNSFALPIVIEGGTVVIGNGSSFGNGAVTFLNGTLTSNYGTSNYTLSNVLEVPSGSTATVNMSSRMIVSGATGGGTLILTVPGTTVDFERLNGSWSTFTGNLNIIGTVSGAKIEASFNGGGFNNLGNATLFLDNVDFGSRGNSGGNTVVIGAVSGTATARLGGAHFGGPQTYNVGALNLNTTFAGVIANSTNPMDSGGNSFNANTTVNKLGSGIWTLTGNSTYLGNTTVSAGTLLVNGALGNTSVTVNANATLGGNGSIGNAGGRLVTFAANSTVTPGDGPGSPGTFKVGNGLTLNGARLRFDLSVNPATGNDAITLNGGALTLSGNNQLQLNLLDGALGAGSYTLISGGASTSGGSPNVALGVSNTRQTLAINSSAAGTLRLVVTGSTAALAWTGMANGTWTTSAVNNWLNGATADQFFNLDTVLFDDTSTTSTVTLSGTLQPALVTFERSANPLTLTGSGALGGSARLVKNGAAQLTLATNNTYTGGAQVNAGTLVLNGNTALGAGLVTLNGGILVFPNGGTLANNFTVASASTLDMAGGSSTLTGSLGGAGNLTLHIPAGATFTQQGSPGGYTGTLAVTGNGILRANNGPDFGYAGAMLVLQDATVLNNRSLGDATLTLGALAGGVNAAIRGSDQAASLDSLCTLVVGGLNLSTTFAGNIANSFVGNTTTVQQVVALTKVGTGALTLAGTCTYSGATLVQAGTLIVSGNLATGADVTVAAGARLELDGGALEVDSVTVAAGATLSGHGEIAGDVTVLGQVLASGGGELVIEGTLTNEGTLRFLSGSGLVVTGSLINNGLIDVISGVASLPEGFINNGVVLDSSVVRVSEFSFTPGNAMLSIQSHSGHIYQLQRATSLGGAWTDVGDPLPGTGGVLVFSDPGFSAAHVFYRIRLDP